VNLLLLGVTVLATWTYSVRAGLLKPDTHAAIVRAIFRRIYIAQTVYAFGALLCLINNYWAIGFIVAIQIHYAIAPRIPVVSELLS
jgi:hypothetical protein